MWRGSLKESKLFGRAIARMVCSSHSDIGFALSTLYSKTIDPYEPWCWSALRSHCKLIIGPCIYPHITLREVLHKGNGLATFFVEVGEMLTFCREELVAESVFLHKGRLLGGVCELFVDVAEPRGGTVGCDPLGIRILFVFFC